MRHHQLPCCMLASLWAVLTTALPTLTLTSSSTWVTLVMPAMSLSWFFSTCCASRMLTTCAMEGNKQPGACEGLSSQHNTAQYCTAQYRHRHVAPATANADVVQDTPHTPTSMAAVSLSTTTSTSSCLASGPSWHSSCFSASNELSK